MMKREPTPYYCVKGHRVEVPNIDGEYPTCPKCEWVVYSLQEILEGEVDVYTPLKKIRKRYGYE